MNSDLPASPASYFIRVCDTAHPHRRNGWPERKVAAAPRICSVPIFCFVLMSIAGVALPPSGTALADEVKGRPSSDNQLSASKANDAARFQDLQRTSSPTFAGSASTDVVTLPDTAGAQGWIGPNAHYFVAPVIRKSHSPYDGPPIPPPAPPTDLPPLPESVSDNETTAKTSNLKSDQPMRSLAASLRVQTVQHRKAAVNGSQTAKLLHNAQQIDAQQNAFQLESPRKLSGRNSVTPIAAQDTPASKAAGSETTGESSLDLTESVRDALTGPAASGIQSLKRPLGQVSLADAQRLESLSGDDLRVPEDRAARLFAETPQQFEFPRGFGVPRPARNARQLVHNPLYFEDPNMERCGIGYGCLTEVASAVRFFGRVPVMPYLMASHPPNSCVRTLGDCPACHAFGVDAYLPPPDPHASAVQAACTLGLIFLIP